MSTVTVSVPGLASGPVSSAARLYTPGVGVLRLPWWPTSVDNTRLGLVWTEQDRPGRRPLLLRQGRQLPQMQVAFTASGSHAEASIATWLATLGQHADSKQPTSLLLAQSNRGRMHLVNLSISETEWTESGAPSRANVDMTLTTVSDASAPIGPVKKKR